MDGLDRVRLFGLDLVDAPDLGPVIDEVLSGSRSDDQKLPVVVTPNVDILVHLDRNPETPETQIYERAQYCLPDGQPLIWVSRLIGERLASRLPGSELFARLWPMVVARELPVVLVASNDVVAQRLQSMHPKAACLVAPVFDKDDADAIGEIVSDVLEASRATKPSMVFFGIGNPKDARIISVLLERWDSEIGAKPLCLGLGGSFLMHLGMRKRAPALIQKLGMEWFYRFVQEPRRLFHRYFVQDVWFLNIAWRELQASRKTSRSK